MTVRNIAWVVCMLASYAVRAAGGQPGSIGTDSCVVRWSEPRPLRVGANTAFLERPASVSLAGHALLLGPRAFVADSTGRPVQPLVPPGAHYIEAFSEIAMGAVSDGRGSWDWVTEPPRVRSMPWLPRAVVDSSNIAHVVWASSDSVVDDMPPTVPSIWYARFDGRRWSEPVHVSSGHRYYWSSANVSQLVLRNGTLHFAVSTVGEGVTYFRGSNAHWTISLVGIEPTYYGYPSIAVLPSGRVVLVVQGPSSPVKNGVASGVFATWSDDGGGSWSKPQLVSTSNAEPAYELQLLESRAILHTLWFQQTDSSGAPAKQANLGNSPGRVHIAESSDGGATWRMRQPTPLLPNADALQTLQLRDGSIAVALADRVAEQILVTRWRRGWLPVAHIDAAPNPLHPALGWGDAQRPVLTWGSRRTHDWFTTFSTTLSLCR